MKIAGVCIDRRVLIGLGVIVIGILFLRPPLIAPVLPYLLVAACPISMLLMMRGMSGMSRPQVDGTTPNPGAAANVAEPPDLPQLRRELAELAARQAWLTAQIAQLDLAAQPTRDGLESALHDGR
ncbi:MAG: DUF2933 domain-containing protein [Candidatus Dormibacteraeota bacterium]|nr:DUF2933 domain-containing protein [Candidatus Dormibacteraeota bacterium]